MEMECGLSNIRRR
ncbi:hypothetical protein Bhyg_02800 [Pseudolycoriella hygida]|uniref:Uncharacterized protein n=1 Tax=Pseudolycoriella hygida TaxID=35572 RepID=A0A9Q0NCX0_9DIPT|nr:hypothetical protein Bhyg_02800 [Pseudolycoriella hygida]